MTRNGKAQPILEHDSIAKAGRKVAWTRAASNFDDLEIAGRQ